MHARLMFAMCASVALLGAGACNNTGTNNTPATTAAPAATPNATGTSGSSDEAKAQPITVTGCLQKDGGDFVMTQINEPPKGEPVAEQDAKEAEHAYRLNAKNSSDEDWTRLVGRQVRISGTIAKRSDVEQKVGTSGSSDKAPKLHESDLAQVDVTDIQQVAANCGHAGKRAAKSARRK